jgi:hypothetical protein
MKMMIIEIDKVYPYLMILYEDEMIDLFLCYYLVLFDHNNEEKDE